MTKILYISDFFLSDLIGGGELSDDVLCKQLIEKGHQLQKKRSHQITHQSLSKYKGWFFIISNFINLKKECKDILTSNNNYIIYEHDHKYLISRNPGLYDNFLAPKEQIINYEFYKNANRVITQTSFHKKIVEKNLKINNVVSISGNFWSLQSLEFLRKMSKVDKNDKYAILNSRTPHKNTRDAIRYCRAKKIDYNLVSSSNYEDFLSKLGQNKKLIFLPKTPETLSRVVVESRMMNMGTILNKNVGASYEDWFGMKGEELIDYMIDKRKRITNTIGKIINE